MTPPSVPRSVLIVEDDADVRETMAGVLETEGFDVHAAREGREALALLRAGVRPDVILLDLMMPGMNGWQLRAEIDRERELAAIPIIVVSAMDPGPDRDRALRAAGYLKKPFNLSALLEAVDAARPGPPGRSAGAP